MTQWAGKCVATNISCGMWLSFGGVGRGSAVVTHQVVGPFISRGITFLVHIKKSIKDYLWSSFIHLFITLTLLIWC